jgi:hypothetical protein
MRKSGDLAKLRSVDSRGLGWLANFAPILEVAPDGLRRAATRSGRIGRNDRKMSGRKIK